MLNLWQDHFRLAGTVTDAASDVVRFHGSQHLVFDTTKIRKGNKLMKLPVHLGLDLRHALSPDAFG